MRMLLLNEEVCARIAAVITYAADHIVTTDDLLDTINGERPPVGDLPGYSVDIPVGFRVVFSIETQTRGLMRHISISVDTAGKTPSPVAVEELIRLFGFRKKMHECYLHLEEAPGKQFVVHIWEELQ